MRPFRVSSPRPQLFYPAIETVLNLKCALAEKREEGGGTGGGGGGGGGGESYLLRYFFSSSFFQSPFPRFYTSGRGKEEGATDGGREGPEETQLPPSFPLSLRHSLSFRSDVKRRRVLE